MNSQSINARNNTNPKINRFLYAGFVVLSMVMLAQGNMTTAMSNLGIALVFDPFDQKQPWAERPLWQRAWLLCHVVALFGMIGYGLITDTF